MKKSIRERIAQKLKDRSTPASLEFIIAMAAIGAILLFIRVP